MRAVRKLIALYNKRSVFLRAIILCSIMTPPLLALSYIIGIRNPSFYVSQVSLLKNADPAAIVMIFVIKAPILEEIIYRGPAWLFLLFLLGAGRLLRADGNSHSWLEKDLKIRLGNKTIAIKTAEALVWPVAIVPTIYWALNHPFPPPVFAAGIVCSWVMIKTKLLLTAILLHMTLNIILIAIGSLLLMIVGWPTPG